LIFEVSPMYLIMCTLPGFLKKSTLNISNILLNQKFSVLLEFEELNKTYE